MKYDTVNYAAVGSFVLLMLVALCVALYHITGRHGRMDHYHAYYGNVAGVKFGTPVYFEGYRVGQVEDIAPERREDGMRYRVSLTIKHDWPVPLDSVAAIASSGLLSDVSIAIVEGSSRERLKPGAEIRSQEGADLFTAFNELAVEVRTLAGGLRPLVQQLNDTLGQGAGPIIADLRNLLEKLNSSADGLNDVLGPSNRREVAQTLQQLNQTSANAQLLSAELLQTRKQVDQLLVQTNSLVTENRPGVQQSVHELRASLLAVSERIDIIMQQIDSTSRNMQEFSREIRANPGRLLADKPPADPVEKRK